MPKMSFRRNGQDDVWVVEFGTTDYLVYTVHTDPNEIEWSDGTVQDAGGILSMYGTLLGQPDLAPGNVYVIFYIKGTAGPKCALQDADLEALTGGATWGIDAWLDQNGAHNWQQY